MRKFKGKVRSAIIIAALGTTATFATPFKKAQASDSQMFRARSFTVQNKISRHHHNSFKRVSIKKINKLS